MSKSAALLAKMSSPVPTRASHWLDQAARSTRILSKSEVGSFAHPVFDQLQLINVTLPGFPKAAKSPAWLDPAFPQNRHNLFPEFATG